MDIHDPKPWRGLPGLPKDPLAIVIGVLIALGPQAAPAADAGRAHKLAERWVIEEENAPLAWTMRMLPLESALVGRSESELGLTGPQKEKVRAAIESAMQVLMAEIVEERISSLAQTFSADEIAGMIAFHHSSVGKAYQAGSTQLALLLAIGGPQTKASDDPKPSAEKLALVDRLLKAEGVEARLRRQQQALSAVATAAESELGSAGQNARQVTSTLKAHDPDYVANAMDATVRFDAKTYSDEQLKALIAYFEGPTGRALITQGPKLESLAVTRARSILERGVARATDAACQAITCDPVQHEKLHGVAAEVQKLLAAGFSTLAK